MSRRGRQTAPTILRPGYGGSWHWFSNRKGLKKLCHGVSKVFLSHGGTSKSSIYRWIFH